MLATHFDHCKKKIELLAAQIRELYEIKPIFEKLHFESLRAKVLQA